MEYQLKVCGLTQLNQITELIDLQIDFLGFIFYEKSPRYVLNHLSLKQISEINHLGKVGVFVNESIKAIAEITTEAQLDIIQLHGGENAEFIFQLREILGKNIKIIKVIRVGNQTVAELQKSINQQPTTINYLLFDTDSKAFGGTGKTFDWNILNELEISIQYFLSGGISLENIHQLSTIKQQAFALDINSKFEIDPGNKDLEKIKTFKSKLNSKMNYIIKNVDELNDSEIKTILNLWEITDWQSLDKEEFTKMFSQSEFHFLMNDNNDILSVLRLNFDFNLEINSVKHSFSEMVGLVAAEKGKAYGSLILGYFSSNIKSRNLDVISFCEQDLRLFYKKSNVEILEGKAKFIKEFENGIWKTSDDDDILIFNLTTTKKEILLELNDSNHALFIN